MANGATSGGLVGRSSEMELAGQLLLEAAAGEPRTLVLTGPAGVGKSTIARELSAQAARSGALTLWGAGQEDLAIPYLSMAMAFEGLRSQGDLEPIVLEADPVRSWSAAGERLLRAAEHQPLVLVVDDLQWTDEASQSLLLHLLVMLEHASQSRPVRALTIVTVRTPTDDERSERTVSRIAREPGVRLLDLHGLDRVAVADLMDTICPTRPSAILVERVSEATDGNPLLIQSLVRRGLSEQRLVERDGALSLRDLGDHLSLDPAELDRSVGDRLEGVGPETRRLLTIASLLGDDQALDELLEVAGLTAEEADPLLDEAIAADLLVERGARCAFPHPQVRHVLFHGPTQRARQQLHLHIAEALERRHGEAGALVVAHHLARAAHRAAPDRVAHWCRLAAQQARSQGAWADASIAGEQALDAIGPDAPWQDRLELHLLVTEMASRGFDLATAVRHGRSAAALAEANGDAGAWGEAILHTARTIVTNVSPGRDAIDPSPELYRFLNENPDADPELRARVLSLLSEIQGVANRVDDAIASATAASALVGPETDPEILGYVLVAEAMARWARLDLAEAMSAYERTVAVVGFDPARRAGMYAGVRLNHLRHLAGEVDRAQRSATEVLAELERAHAWGEHAVAAAGAAATALAQARFDDVERMQMLTERSVRRSGHRDPLLIVQPAVALARAIRGDARGGHEAIDVAFAGSGIGARYHLAIDALLGDVDRVAGAVSDRPWRDPDHQATMHTLPSLVIYAEVAVALRQEHMARQAIVPLLDAHQRGLVLSPGWTVLLSRLVGECLTVTGEREDAARWFAAAGDEARSLGLPLEGARVELARARLLASDPGVDRQTLFDQASTAAAELDRLGALPLVASARRIGHLEDEAGPATRVILFTDLVDSTALNVRAGDRAFLDLVREHNDIVRLCLRRSSGVEFKHTGDGVAAWFTDPTDAIECAMAITEELDRATMLHPDLPLLVRCGLSSGEPLGNEGDLFGLSVVRAARLCAAAEAGEVLVGPEVVGPARTHGVVFEPKGEMVLKGFPDPIDVYVAVMTAARTGSR